MRYADDVPQTAIAPKSSSLSLDFLATLLRDRLETRYKKHNGKGVTSERPDDNKFIGLEKIFTVTGSVRLRPCAASLVEGELPHESELLSSIPHFDGWYPSAQPYAILCGFAARAITLSSAPDLAHLAMIDFLELFVSSAHFPDVQVKKLAKRWDDLHPCAKLRCVRAASAALARASARSSFG